MSRPVVNIRGGNDLTLTPEQLRTLLEVYGLGPGTPALITTRQLTSKQITHALQTGKPLGLARQPTEGEFESVTRWINDALNGKK